MKLLIDIGNSALKWATLQEGQLHFEGFAEHDGHDALSLFREHFKDLPKISSVWVSNVAGEVFEKSLSDWVKQHWGLTVNFVRTEKQHVAGLKNGYDYPEQLGVDRWLAMLGAWQKFQKTCCIIDCGTAITVDVINDQGQHLGGLIFPGVGLMGSLLHEYTAQCSVDPKAFSSQEVLLATNTRDAIAQASVCGAVSFIESVVVRVRKNANSVLCLLTGGYAERWGSQLSFEYQHEPYLVFEGLKNYC